jgi:hypothetical protein
LDSMPYKTWNDCCQEAIRFWGTRDNASTESNWDGHIHRPNAKMSLWACGWGDWVCLGLRQKLIPTTTSERQERQGQFPSDCEKMLFKGSYYNRASTTVFTVSKSIHSFISQTSTRATHRVIVNNWFGRCRLSCERRKAAEKVQDTQMCHGLWQRFL